MTQITQTTHTVTLRGASGKTYIYWVYPFPFTTVFDPQPANYAFYRSSDGRLIYIGETGDLSERFGNHHKMPCIARNQADQFLAHKSSADAVTRRVEEADLVDYYTPTCNG